MQFGGAFEQLFCHKGREFEQANLQKLPGGLCGGGGGGGGVKLSN